MCYILLWYCKFYIKKQCHFFVVTPHVSAPLDIICQVSYLSFNPPFKWTTELLDSVMNMITGVAINILQVRGLLPHPCFNSSFAAMH